MNREFEHVIKLQEHVDKQNAEIKQLKQKVIELEMSIKNVQDYSEKLYNDNRELEKRAGEAEGARDELRRSLANVRAGYRD